MADTEQEPAPGEKEANKPPSPKPDQEPGEVAPPLVSVTNKSKYKLLKNVIAILIQVNNIINGCICSKTPLPLNWTPTFL